jgi:protein gp37
MFRTRERLGMDPRIVMRSTQRDFDLPFRLRSGMVQVCSQSDFFVADADEWREEAWDVIRQTPHLTYQILTKRPGRILSHLPYDWGAGWDHVWFGTSTEDQETADIRLRQLLRVPAAKYFMSAQPLLEPIAVRQYLGPQKVSLVLAGCESGPGARPTEASWLRVLEKQAENSGATFFLVQETVGGTVVRSSFHNDRTCHWSNFYPFNKSRKKTGLPERA